MIKESLAHGSHPTLGILCRSCGNPVTVYGWDKDHNPIHDPTCSPCTVRRVRRIRIDAQPEPPAPPRIHCNRCYDGQPLPGMAWCKECALKAQEERIAAGEDPLIVEHTIASIRAAIASAGETR